MDEPKLPMMDVVTIALATAVCDVLASEMGKLEAVMRLLQDKGLVSGSELLRTIESIRDIEPEIAEKHSAILVSYLQKRLASRYQQILLETSAPKGPTQ